RAALRDPVPWLMAGVWLGYLASLPLLFPAYLPAVLPLVWSYYLDLGGTTVGQVLITQRMGTAMCLLLPLLFITWRWRGAGTEDALPRVLALAGVATLAAAIVQHKG